MPTILIVRHAQASYGTGDYDILSALGHQQVQALVSGLQRRRAVPDRVLCGGLRRHRETAGPCAASAGVDLVIDERWDEYDDEDVMAHHSSSSARVQRQSGAAGPALSSREFQAIANEALQGWLAAGTASRCRQSWPQFSTRVQDALEDLARRLGKGETAVVVSSSGVIAAVAVALLRLPGEALISYNHVSVNTGITKLVVGRGGISLVSFNEHVHLEEVGPSLITYR